MPSSAADVDFNRDVRPILSNKCILCHGPDPEGLQAGLRLDLRDVAVKELESGSTAIVPGKPEDSELIARVTSADADLRMPPAEHGAALTAAEVDVLTRWIQQGAPYAKHWSYVKPVRPDVPEATDEFATWPQNPVDNFVLQKMVERIDAVTGSGWVCGWCVEFTDLTGLPPTIEEADAFVASQVSDAYDKLVDDLLQRPTFGEHWARKWLDLARYADSAGYADDPPRTIWAYRDWVIKAMNSNMPFDQFTREQLAGDLLPNPTEPQLIATAFHRNTLTNNEGGTQDEEFRNVAVVDRVNTTMAVWMGTTMACAQCHTHKYDPITQEEYFRFFAIFNNTEDADRRDESPLVEIYTEEQKQQKLDLEAEIATLKTQINTATPELVAAQQQWEVTLQKSPTWSELTPTVFTRASEQPTKILPDGAALVETESLEALPVKDTYTLELPVSQGTTIAGLKLSALPHLSLPNHGSGHAGGNFVITGVKAQIAPTESTVPQARFVRITNNGKQQILSLAEVEVFSGGTNIALQGRATQDSTAFNGPAGNAIDGNTDGDYQKNSVTHSETVDDPWWEIDLGSSQPIDRIVIWNRTDNNLHTRLKDFTVQLLDNDRTPVLTQQFADSPNPSTEYSPSNVRDIAFQTAFADYHQPNFEPADVLTGKSGNDDGWAIGGQTDVPHQLVVVPKQPIVVAENSKLRITIEQNSPHARHLIGHFRFSTTDDDTAIQRSRLQEPLLATLDKPQSERSVEEADKLAAYYREHEASLLKPERNRLAVAERTLTGMKPATSVPVLREILTKRRETHLQHRGSYLDKGPLVEAGLPTAFHALPDRQPLDRLAVAEWLTSEENPLTGRVLANRFWETLFGRGIVVTSEEFGSQGEAPTHPELLDWLATEFLRNGWDTKDVIRTLVTSATYRQSAQVTADRKAIDPDNRWLSRGPRVRLSAEMVRDQALAVSGLLSDKMFGPPVKPPQPNLGLTAAFGSSTDWKTSEGEDRYRRGLYTTWRRSNPYPSMATFDAPNREVCTVRRSSTNTPLQSLVTLNDPAYVEAAQALGRLALQHSDSLEERITLAFRRCVLRPPTAEEVAALAELFSDSRDDIAQTPDEAMKLATDPIGPVPEGIDTADAAAMTVVCNVLLNLDEMFLKR
ncbi:MAG: DUF1553 domain-containing protein [Planctomycetaceae bacterium]